jgi:hypothetical protein
MAPLSTKARKKSAKKSSGSLRWLLAGAGVSGVAAAGVLAASLLSSHEREAQSVPAGQCPHLEVDQTTGAVRDKGLMPCNQMYTQGGRVDQIRESFKAH